MDDTPKRRGRKPVPEDQKKGETPVFTIRLQPEDGDTMKRLHRLGRFVPYLRRARKTLPPSD